MFVKICGTTSLRDAELAVKAGADALGFIFAPSRRRISVEQVVAITAQLPAPVVRVGVFTEANFNAIAHAVRAARLSAAQLHMTQNPELLGRLYAEFGSDLELWQVVQYEVAPGREAEAETSFVKAVAAAMEDSRIAVVLLDTAKAGSSGGLGLSFPWDRAVTLMEQARRLLTRPVPDDGSGLPRVILAGGLHAGNVAEAIRTLLPHGVDCVSGVEAEPGRKDPQRLSAFFTAARGGR